MKTFIKGYIQLLFKRAGIYPLNPEPVLRAIKLRTEKKLGNQEVKGRVYTLNKNCLNEAIYVSVLNEPQARMEPPKCSIWEEQPDTSPDFDSLYSDIPSSNNEMELPLLNQAQNQSTNDTNDLIQLFSETNITDYSKENSGIEGLNL
jgi:hypothetical protein